MPNPYVNKVVYGNETIIDLTGDNVLPADVRQGVHFHGADGAPNVGTSSDVHNDLTGRDAADAHPMSAITGLVTALAGKQDTISDLATIRSGAALGATALQAVPNTYRTAAAQDTIDATKQEKATAVTGTGAVNFTVADNREYSYTGVTSLTMAAANVEAHGFVTFGSTTPTISITGFAGSGGDDITGAAASEVWEFSVFSHNSGAYILWKKWSA